MSGTARGQSIMDLQAATVILDYLVEHPAECAVVSGRIGALPHVRYRSGRWQVASWAGAGDLMTNSKTRAEVRTLLQGGPHVKLVPCTECTVWEAAADEHAGDDTWEVEP